MDVSSLETWVSGAQDSDFSIHNLPFGIFSRSGRPKRVGVAIGHHVVDLVSAYELEVLGNNFDSTHLAKEYLNSFIGLGKEITSDVRRRLQRSLCDENSALREGQALVPQDAVTMHLPIKVGDYTDFYSSIEHATNVGSMFRDPANPLLPNWRHMPIAYHGRASSIIVTGQSIYRPYGQIKRGEAAPAFQPTNQLDFELEVAFITGKSTQPGEIISTQDAEDYIFGLVLFNDWSARDIQRWEYVPLGPFLGKNFASSISPWVVTLEALAPFRTDGPPQEPAVLPYLQFEGQKNFDIDLEVTLMPTSGKRNLLCKTNTKHLYWNMSQQLAHHTSNGCNINIGDLMASGTISGPTKDSFGSMLELSWGGAHPIQLRDGTTRTFLEDGDTVTIRGASTKEEIRVGFGEVTAKILPPMM